MDPSERLLVVTATALVALVAFLVALYLVLLAVLEGGGGIGCAALAVPPLAGLGGALAALLVVRLLAERS